MVDDLEELKNLPPQERLRKLKELEKKRKKEEEKAKALEDVSKQQIADQQEWERKVPIPQLATEEGHALISEDEKQLQSQHKLQLPKIPVEEDESSKAKSPKQEISLEETVAQEPIPDRLQEAADIQYGAAQLAQVPAVDLYAQARRLQDEVQHQGYMTFQQQEEFQRLSGATYMKGEAMAAGGSYAGASEGAKTTLGGLKNLLQSMYQKKEEIEKGVKGPSMSGNYQRGTQ